MKTTSFVAATGLAAIASALSDPSVAKASGKAIIISYCSANVYLQNTPSGSAWVDTAILNSSNPEYSQYYSQLPDDDGWSIKFGPESDLSTIMQYEYTWQGTGEPVWYDMSLVNSAGSPLYDWTFVSSDTSTCNPNDADYFTDATTVTGMQTQCADTIDLTLYLCPDSAAASSSVAAASSTAATATTSTEAAATTTAVPVTTTTEAATTVTATTEAATTTAAATTLATTTKKHFTHFQNDVEVAASTSTAADGAVVTEYDVAYVTEVATYTAYVTERDAEATPAVHRRHVHGHPHARN